MKLWPFSKGRPVKASQSEVHEFAAEDVSAQEQNDEAFDEGADAGGKARRFSGLMRIGIRPRLYCAFGGVVALTLLASGVAWYSYTNVEQAYGSATERDVPAMNASLRLRGDALQLASDAPLLARTSNETARKELTQQIDQRVEAIRSRMEELEGYGVRGESLEQLSQEVDTLATAMNSLDDRVSQALSRGREISRMEEEAAKRHEVLLKQIRDTLDSVQLSFKTAVQETTLAAGDTIRSLVRRQVGLLRNALDALIDASHLTSVLSQVPNVEEESVLAEMEMNFITRLASFDSKVRSLNDQLENEALAEAVDKYAALGSSDESVFQAQKELLEAPAYSRSRYTRTLQARLDEVVSLNSTFLGEMGPVVSKVYSQILDGADEATNNNTNALSELIENDVGALFSLMRVEAESNLMLGVLTRVSAAGNTQDVDNLEEAFGASRERADEALADYEDTELPQAFAALASLGQGDESLFAERREQSKARFLATTAANEVDSAVAGLRDGVSTVITEVESGLEAGTASVQNAIETSKLWLAGIAVASVVISVLIAWLYVGRNLVDRISRLSHSMKEISEGDLTADVPAGGRDEIADMANALSVFRDNLAEAAEERKRREEERAEQAKRRREEMVELAGSFESSVKSVVESVSSSAKEMEGTAGSMSDNAKQTGDRVQTVASASQEASSDVQTAASAAQELAGSIAEIGRQVARSNEISSKASESAEASNTQVAGLSEAAQKIGDVVKLIQDIAEQTNLLALNATIEAARAGEAGKGFAVVASEVKNLANQTAKATEEISQQISGIQNATEDTVSMIQGISSVISEMNEISTSISAAVEEQGAATDEIASTMNRVSDGTQKVNQNIEEVSADAQQTGAAANQVLTAAAELSRQADTLRGEVDSFVEKVRSG
ncbi:methyl-accepting chemotaxis protein [Fodinicurvata sediminis]|uniref:methyl-accepting chemotaxis protein n=1 Tax=Fodinicurvata sediminis TaxID=1121832 RepID=UPI0003B3E283|nr:methyl-accepting chemotaxis protein [Fodinicurvata sediminis]